MTTSSQTCCAATNVQRETVKDQLVWQAIDNLSVAYVEQTCEVRIVFAWCGTPERNRCHQYLVVVTMVYACNVYEK